MATTMAGQASILQAPSNVATQSVRISSSSQAICSDCNLIGYQQSKAS